MRGKTDSPSLMSGMPDSAVCLPLTSRETFCFEPWEQGLRCWLSKDGGRARATVFPYRVLNEDDPDKINDDLDTLFTISHGLSLSESDSLHYSIRIDQEKLGGVSKDGLAERLRPFRDMLLAIPYDIRRLAALCGKRHYLALEAMRHIPEFADFIGQEARATGLSYILSVWALGKALEQPLMFRLELARRMISTPRVRMFEILLDEPCTKALPRLLAKIPVEDIKQDVIETAVEVVSRQAMQQATGNLKLISGEALIELSKLPDWLVTPTLVSVLSGPLHEGNTLSSILPPSLLNAPVEARDRLRVSLSGAENAGALEKRVYQWADRLYYEVSFPSPPMRGSGKLKPLRTGLMLRREGRKMHHCVAGYAEDVLDGKCYFYSWHGDIRATVQLDRTREGRWKLVEALGVENDPLPDSEMQQVALALAEAFGDEGLFLLRCHVAGTGYYDYDKAIRTLSHHAPLKLIREPENPYDGNAIEVYTIENMKLGYVPQRYNEQAAQWLNAGLPVCAQMVHRDGWHLELFMAPK